MSSCKTRDYPESVITSGHLTSEKACESCTTEKPSYGFYSRELKQVFDSVEELEAAELKLHEEQDAKAKLQLEKKERAKKVEDAYLELQKVKEEAYAKISEAEKKWLKLRDEFAKDYNGYHMTYTNVNGKKEITFNDLINGFFLW